MGMERAHETSEDEAEERFEKRMASAGEFPGSSEVDTDVSDRSESTPLWRSNRGLSNKNERTVVCVEKRNDSKRTEDDLEAYMKRCKKDWTHEEQNELLEAIEELKIYARSLDVADPDGT